MKTSNVITIFLLTLGLAASCEDQICENLKEKKTAGGDDNNAGGKPKTQKEIKTAGGDDNARKLKTQKENNATGGDDSAGGKPKTQKENNIAGGDDNTRELKTQKENNTAGDDDNGGGKPKTQILVVVDMENAYCTPEVCGEWYNPVRDDGPGYSFTPRSWLGPACGNKCKKAKDCWDQAKEEKTFGKVTGFKESIRTMTCQRSDKTAEHGICACDSVPSEREVISYITKIIGATKVSDNSTYWDHIIFTHDWDDYGQVCSVGLEGNDDIGHITADDCWKQSAQHGSTTCGTNEEFGCTSSLVAWSKGTEIVKPLQDAVDKAFALDSGMQSDNVHHVVKKHANWGLARHQSMNKMTEPQGKRTPFYLLEDLNISPKDTSLTVTGSFTQYCVMAGVFQMVLAGYDDIVIAEAATGGYMDSQAIKLCEKGKSEDKKGNRCPIPPPSKKSSFSEWSAWMALTGQGEGNYEPPQNSVNNVQTTKAIALSWMEDIGVTVKKSKEGEPLEKGWKKYTDWMNDQGVSIQDCVVEGWC